MTAPTRARDAGRGECLRMSALPPKHAGIRSFIATELHFTRRPLLLTPRDSTCARRTVRGRARSGREAAVGVAFEMLLGIALLSLAAGPSAAAAKPSKPAKQPKQLPEVVKARIKLIDLYCNTDPKESVLINTSPTEKATAAKRVPCQARPRDTLTMTAPNIVPHALTQLGSHACWSLPSPSPSPSLSPSPHPQLTFTSCWRVGRRWR